MNYTYYTADVFTDTVFQGAQIAVFPEFGSSSDKPSDELMLLIAGELNLSETVFITATDQAQEFRLRIFSPKGEVDFAGHPMLAAAKALVASKRIDLIENGASLVFQQNTGDVAVNVRQYDNKPLFVQFSLKANAIIDHYTPTEAELARLLNIDERDIDTRTFHTRLAAIDRPYLIVPLLSQQAVRKARFNLDAWSQSSAPTMAAQEIFLFGSKTDTQDTDFHGRLVGPSIGTHEDPPIGSAMPCFAAYLGDHEHIREGTYTFTIDRGTPETRRSVLHIEIDHRTDKPSTLRVGGEVVLVSENILTLET